jgi:hypothetical protein
VSGTDSRPAAERGARYQRSFSGLVAAIVITLLVVAAFVVFRGTFRAEVDNEPVAVDYREQVGYAQESGMELVYPRSLPAGWIATSVDLQPGPVPAWGIGMLTDDDEFVGVRQEDTDVDSLLETYVDDERHRIEQRADVDLDSELAGTWQRYADEGGDLAFAAEVEGQVVLVYGSAGEDELEDVVRSLTTEPVGP